jgi:hypothetical protein
MAQTSVEWLVNHWKKLQSKGAKMSWNQIIEITELAKEMEGNQRYTKQEFLDAAEFSEVCMIDAKYIVSNIDEARELKLKDLKNNQYENL